MTFDRSDFIAIPAFIIIVLTIVGAGYQLILNNRACHFEPNPVGHMSEVCVEPKSICSMNYKYLPTIFLTCVLSEERK